MKKPFIGYYCECDSSGGHWRGPWYKVGRYKTKEEAVEGVQEFVTRLRGIYTVEIKVVCLEEKNRSREERRC